METNSCYNSASKDAKKLLTWCCVLKWKGVVMFVFGLAISCSSCLLSLCSLLHSCSLCIQFIIFLMNAFHWLT